MAPSLGGLRHVSAPNNTHNTHTNEHTHRLEEVLSTRRYLAGDRVTLSDVRVFPSLARFDEVYNVYFKCNKKRLADFPNILNYLRDLYQTYPCLLYTSPSPRDKRQSRMPSSA